MHMAEGLSMQVARRIGIAIFTLVGPLGVAVASPGDDLELAAPHLRLAETLRRRGDHRGAIKELETALRLAPSRKNLLFNLGSEHYNAAREQGWPLEDMKRAIAYFERYLAAEPTVPDRRRIEQALALMKARIFTAAEHHAGGGPEETRPGHAPTATASAGGQAKASPVLLAAVDLDTAAGQDFALGFKLAQQGRHLEATRVYQRAREEEQQAARLRDAEQRARQAAERADRAEQQAAEARRQVEEARRQEEEARRRLVAEAEVALRAQRLRVIKGAGIVGAGLVLTVAGTVLLMVGETARAELDLRMRPRPTDVDPLASLLSRTQGFSVAGGVLAGAGVLAAIWGSVIALAPTPSGARGSIAVLPSVGGLVIQGVFR